MNRDGALLVEGDLMALMVGDLTLEDYRNSPWFDELHSGLRIACTNRVNAVDPALRRRFHKHVTCVRSATRHTFAPASWRTLTYSVEKSTLAAWLGLVRRSAERST